MNDSEIVNIPAIYPEIQRTSKEIGFTMPSDLYVGTLLKTLIASKPNSNILELGTGVGLSLSWMIDGMDATSQIISVDNDPKLIKLANRFFGNDNRVQIINADGSEWIKSYNGKKFDLVFADAWPGKYSEIEEILSLINLGGFYVIDDMLPQSNWPEGHQENVDILVNYIEERKDFNLTKLNWSTGVIIASRIY